MSKKLVYICILAMGLVLLMCVYATTAAAIKEEAYKGVPIVNLMIDKNTLDQSGNLIYIGLDIGVFVWDDSKNGYVAKENKIKRFLTTSTNITVDLGESSEYEKGVKHVVAYRTLYVPVGATQDTIVIASESNGKEGWIKLEDSLFIPTYFGNYKTGSPFITHTEKWSKNLEAYNKAKLNAHNEDNVRGWDTFWSGEQLVVNIEGLEEIPYLEIKIDGIKKTITFKEKDNETGLLMYTCEVWGEEMINKYGNYTTKTIPYEINVKESESGAILETVTDEIIFDNRDLYYRVVQVY